MFDNYRIPRANLLNRTADVTENGEYVLNDENGGSSQIMAFIALSMGRMDIINTVCAYATNAMTIAVRYSAVRRQFGPRNEGEWPVLEYQTHVSMYSILNSVRCREIPASLKKHCG